ncbi:hypothetical protein [Clostridium mediterraneense]|uniref:hypothetical protein n=1 Tax=Clostridium mediterraneense TaxID=1805472 RepID=UPI00082C7699|nr:hypothetical protein [Clostridium mediterraneense]
MIYPKTPTLLSLKNPKSPSSAIPPSTKIYSPPPSISLSTYGTIPSNSIPILLSGCGTNLIVSLVVFIKVYTVLVKGNTVNIKFINKTINTLKENSARLIEEKGEDVLEFSDKTPEIFESLDELESTENEEIIINTWEDFVTCFDSPTGEEVLTALALTLCF